MLTKAYKMACMAELQALKPGNVHVFADGHGMTVHDFINSADVTAEIMSRPHLTVGERVLRSVQATHDAVGQNTNLGMLLLCAPIIQAALSIQEGQTFTESIHVVLNTLTVEDAQHVAEAIVLANPAGLGNRTVQDVRIIPNVTLLEMMRLAEDDDRIAWQYANAYQDIINFGTTRYADAMIKWENSAWATVALYLGYLTRFPDTHIMRKYNKKTADDVLKEAERYEALYWATENPKLVQKQLLDWDMSLKKRGLNPGTAADLTVATLLVTALV